MDRIEEFATPITRVLGDHPAYTFSALSLGFFLYRWNTNRVGYCPAPSAHRAEDCL